MGNIIVIFLAVAILISSVDSLIQEDVINTLGDLEFDENGHLARNYLLHQENNPQCIDKFDKAWRRRADFKLRDRLIMSDDFAEAMGFYSSQEAQFKKTCRAVALDRGTSRNHTAFVIPEKLYSLDTSNIEAGEAVDQMHQWLSETAMRVELGFINWQPNVVEMWWLNDELPSSHPRARVYLGDIHRKEKATQWQTTTLGHRFEIIDKVSRESYGIYRAEFSRFVVLGQTPEEEYLGHEVDYRQISQDVLATFDNEWKRAHRVKRTFTSLGFNKAKLPDDLWASISSYYYNNQRNAAIEEWGGKGVFVNWWEVPSWMVGIPWGLKTYWQSRLKDLVEEWSGITLELTDIYGMREYKDGARLLAHVDREETHAASLIINVAQSGIRAPWMLEIYDFANRLHEVEMEPGDIVYYESARCLHGRMSALQGESYVNLFAHYRPVGDPKWFLKENPENTPEQLHDLETTGVSDFVKGLYRKFASKSRQVLEGPHSLHSFWLDLTKKAVESHGFAGAEL